MLFGYKEAKGIENKNADGNNQIIIIRKLCFFVRQKPTYRYLSLSPSISVQFFVVLCCCFQNGQRIRTRRCVQKYEDEKEKWKNDNRKMCVWNFSRICFICAYFRWHANTYRISLYYIFLWKNVHSISVVVRTRHHLFFLPPPPLLLLRRRHRLL